MVVLTSSILTSHKHLIPFLKKLNSYGYVSYNGFSSRMFNINVGVPQGSNLGALLVNLFVNDLFESLTCTTIAYADDLKLYAEITCQADLLTNLRSMWMSSLIGVRGPYSR